MIRFCSVYVVCVLRYFIVCTVVLILRGEGWKEGGALRIASFGIASFGIASFGIATFGIASFGIASFEIASFEIASFEIASFEIASFEIASFSTKGSNCFLCGRLASFEYGCLIIK